MAYLLETYLTKESLKELLREMDDKGLSGISVITSVNNEVKNFTTKDGRVIQQNVSCYVGQNKEDRDAKKKKFYFMNGRQVWDDGKLVESLKLYKDGVSAQLPSPSNKMDEILDMDDDLPF